MKIQGITNIKYFSKGKRGIIYTGIYKKTKVAIKTKNPDSYAINRIQNEAIYLKLLNKHKIGPTLLKATKKYIIYKFVEGEYIKDKIDQLTKKNKIILLKNILKQCHKMDRLGIDKEEMHRPLKHIVLAKSPIMLDFEKCHKTNKPKNVTQLLQYMRNLKILTKKKILTLAREYKKSLDLKPILKALK